MRTNIELDDVLLAEARRYSRARTKRGVVEEALATFVHVKAEERRRASYAERVREVGARLGELRLRESPLDLLRRDRSR